MNSDGKAVEKKTLRILPGVVIVVIQWFMWLILPLIAPVDEVTMASVAGGVLGGIAVALWWLFWSKAQIIDRVGAILLSIISLLVTALFVDISISTSFMGLMLIMYSFPVMSLALVVSAAITRNLPDANRRAVIAGAILLAAGVFLFIKTEGLTGAFRQEIAWRWSTTAEQKLLDVSGNESMGAAVKTKDTGEWPGFRGKDRDGVAGGIKISADWKATPPVLLWKRQVGPACSSIAAGGGLIYTQEQRGENEAVTCYSLDTGKPVWMHTNKARFWDSHVGAGPRGTPALYKGRVYTFGGTGILNVLDAVKGTLVWSRDVSKDADVKALTWGFSSSPLIYGNMVYVAAAGKMAAYDLASGKPKWFGPEGGKCYSSPHLVTISGVPQILLLSEPGAVSFNPLDGKVLWTYPWKCEDRVLQPLLTGDGGILLSVNLQEARRIDVSAEKGKNWKVKEGWVSSAVKPNFNDYALAKGYAYGYNGVSLVCVDVKDGTRKWKGGNYGGQLILIAESGLLLVASEAGELVLVEAAPQGLKELAKFPAIKGRIWNHPALAGDIFLVRNSNEMAAIRLPKK
ncbi:MAG: PQQ-binding-like beta-propeller repeat protein [Candidatus Firestonebacteria bacterium]